MRRRFRRSMRAAAVVAVTALGPGSGFAEVPVVTSSARERTALALTVYNGDRSLVRDERAVELPAGASDLRFADVADEVEPPTVHVDVLEGAPFAVLEQNYEYDLLEPDAILRKRVGRTVELERESTRKGSTTVARVPATLLSAQQGAVWAIGGRIVTEVSPSMAVFPEVPADLVASPTLVWRVDAAQAGRRRIETTYLTGGLSWNADYRLTLEPGDQSADLQGWVTVGNGSEVSFENARLQLVAGEVHRAPPPRDEERELMFRSMTETIEVVAEESLFEYHLYTLPALTSLKAQQTKQVELLEALRFPVTKEYLLRGDAEALDEDGLGHAESADVGVAIQFKNEAAAGLGIPLPRGTLRVYKSDSTGQPQFLREAALDHTPKDEEVSVDLGTVFDLTAERTLTAFKEADNGNVEKAFEIRIRNHKSEPVTVRVVESMGGGDWTLLEHSHPFRKTAAFQAEFVVPVAAGQETLMRYRVRVR